MAESNLGTLAVYLTAKTDKFNNALRSANRAIGQFSMTAKIGAAAGIAAIGAFAIKSVKSYSESEEAINNLESALAAGGDNIQQYSERFQKFASDMEGKTIIDDEAIINTMAFGRNLGITADKLEESTKAAAGLAAKYNIDVMSAMQLIGKAYNGNTAALGRYGIALDENMTKEQKFNELLKIGTSNFSLAESKTNTLAGKTAQLGNAWGNLQEEFGKLISDGLGINGIFDMLIGKVKDLTESVKINGKEWQYVFQEIGIYIQSSVQAWAAILKPFWTAISTSIMFIWDVFQTAGANMGNVIIWIAENWNKAWKNMGNIAFALGKDLLSFYNTLYANIWKTLTFQETDWTGMLADLGKNVERELSKAKIAPLELKNVDYSRLGEGFGKAWEELKSIPDKIAEIAGARDAAIDKLFNDAFSKAAEKINANPLAMENQTTEKQISKPEMKFGAAVEKGTVEAYRAELAGKNTTEEHTKKTANNTEKTYKAIDRTNQLLRPLANLGVA